MMKSNLDTVKIFIDKHQSLIKIIGVWGLWIGLALCVRIFLFQPFNIPSRSMVPTLLVGDHLFVSKWAYGYSRYAFPFQSGEVSGKAFSSVPKRGDVVVFRPPKDNKQDYIKRIIAIAGDRVQMKNSMLYLNDKKISRKRIAKNIYQETLPSGKSYLTKDLTSHSMGDNTPVYEVPKDHVFVMGDNRDNSTDSRFYSIGPIPLKNLIGRANVIYISFNSSDDEKGGYIRFNRLGQSIE